MTKHQTFQMFSSILILALKSSTSTAATTELCTKAKIQSIEEKYAACTSKIHDNLMSRDDGDNLKLNEVCQMINETVLGCVQVYAQCQMNDTSRQVYDHQLEAFSEMFAPDDPMGKLAKECQMNKDPISNVSKERNGDVEIRINFKCDQETALKMMEK